MKRILRFLIVCLMAAAAYPAEAQLVTGKRGSDDFQIGVAGYTYRNFTIDQTLEYLRSLGVKYLSIKDFWLPLDATAEEMHEFKAKCSQYGVEGYILGPIYMNSEAEVDRAFAYAGRCLYCPNESCARLEGRPCRHPELVRPSLEACGFDLCRTTEELMAIPLRWGEGDRMPEYLTLVSGFFHNADRIDMNDIWKNKMK